MSISWANAANKERSDVSGCDVTASCGSIERARPGKTVLLKIGHRSINTHAEREPCDPGRVIPPNKDKLEAEL